MENQNISQELDNELTKIHTDSVNQSDMEEVEFRPHQSSVQIFLNDGGENGSHTSYFRFPSIAVTSQASTVDSSIKMESDLVPTWDVYGPTTWDASTTGRGNKMNLRNIITGIVVFVILLTAIATGVSIIYKTMTKGTSSTNDDNASKEGVTKEQNHTILHALIISKTNNTVTDPNVVTSTSEVWYSDANSKIESNNSFSDLSSNYSSKDTAANETINLLLINHASYILSSNLKPNMTLNDSNVYMNRATAKVTTTSQLLYSGVETKVKPTNSSSGVSSNYITKDTNITAANETTKFLLKDYDSYNLLPKFKPNMTLNGTSIYKKNATTKVTTSTSELLCSGIESTIKPTNSSSDASSNYITKNNSITAANETTKLSLIDDYSYILPSYLKPNMSLNGTDVYKKNATTKITLY